MTLIDVFQEIFTQANLNIFKELDLYKEELLARHYWPDGKCLDLFSTHEKNLFSIEKVFGKDSAAEFDKFHGDCETLFYSFNNTLLRNGCPGSFFTKKDFLKGASVIIWTTTPWTIPANKALAFNSNIDSSVLEIERLEHFKDKKIITYQVRII